jgi:hypothetical protein
MKDNKGDERDKEGGDNEHEVMASAVALNLKALRDYTPYLVTKLSLKNSHAYFTSSKDAPSCYILTPDLCFNIPLTSNFCFPKTQPHFP